MGVTHLRLHLPMLFVILSIMVIGICTISITTQPLGHEDHYFFTRNTIKQVAWCGLGWVAYFIFAVVDYTKWKHFSWIVYFFMIMTLLGLFFSHPVHSVHRWYRLPFFDIQPSEFAKLALILSLAAFLESYRKHVHSFVGMMQALALILIPTFLILKQPDLGTSLIFLFVGYGMIFIAGGHRATLLWIKRVGFVLFSLAALIFVDAVSYDKLRPLCLKVMKEYQYKRLLSGSYHQKASLTAIGLGGFFGVGYGKSGYSAKRWLPAAHTDSIFAAFGEHFGLLGLYLLMALFAFLLYLSGQIAMKAKDHFGKLLAVGVTLYLAFHIAINMGMGCGLFPITGVPLVLMTYGGSSMLCVMAALGMLQSVHTRRFRF